MKNDVNNDFSIATVSLANSGSIGLCRLPGRTNALETDVGEIQKWQASHVVSLNEASEMQKHGAKDLSQLLRARQIGWWHFPIVDYGVPEIAVEAEWPKLSSDIKQALSARQNVLLHCYGGIGRSGMVALRLMIELGEEPEAALMRLRDVRPGAVETEAQMKWAMGKTS
jgi:protein-tyrosine phosphatase